MNNKKQVYGEFVVRPYSTELYHYAMKHADKNFKYIRKERKNGKWRYYYDEDNKGSKNIKPLPSLNNTTSTVSKPNPNRSLKDSIPKLKDPEPATTNTAKRINPNRSLKDSTVKLKDSEPVATNTSNSTKRINPNRSLKDNIAKLKDTGMVDNPKQSDKKEDAKRTAVNYGVDHGPAAKFLSIEEMPKKTTDMTADEDQKAVNPRYNPEEPYYSENCAYCSATWDLRRRGYDVEAQMCTSAYDTNMEEIASWYGATLEDIVGISQDSISAYGTKMCEDTMKSILSAEGEGSYGNFMIHWNNGGGHSVVWTVENGNVMIRDTQLNTVDTYEDYMNKYRDYLNSYYYLRTDNREITPAILEVARRREKHANVS